MLLNADEERLMIKHDMKNCLDFSYSQGKKFAQINIARKMKQNGLDINYIAKITDLSEQEILEL